MARVSGTMLASNRGAYAIMRGLNPIERSSLSGGVRELVARVAARMPAAA